MKNLILTLSLMMCSACALAADEVTDITSQYITNPSFETDTKSGSFTDTTRGAYSITSLTSWTLTAPTSTWAACDIMTSSATATDNDFGKPGTPSDGTYMLYLRDAWTDCTASVKQNITVPAGNYKLTVDYKCVTAGSHTATLAAGSESSGLSFQSSMPSSWSTGEVYFSLDKETTVNIGVSIGFTNSSGGSVLLDNFRLYSLPEDYTGPDETEVSSPTEGVITADFVSEDEMMLDLLQMIANFSEYMVNNFFYCVSTNSKGETCGFFYNEAESGANVSYNNEASVRVNADLSMLCAFLVKYAKGKVTLPSSVTWDKLAEMAKYSLIYSYSTHKGNKLKGCTGDTYWGSTSTSDYTWESSLWAMSVAYSAYFQWDELTSTQQNYVYNMLKAECNYELNRSIPTQYNNGDTRAEENGWEVDILAATLGLFPEDALASQWYERMREFAINSYSHYSDASDNTVIDPDTDSNKKTVANLYVGNNLYTDYTLQNHNLFHTSYQNVVMQELGEAALALKMFQGDKETWQSNALMHNNQEVMDSVLNWLALTDGELAMPNGNDWSLFLYDQLPSYSTQACFQRDANALMLENLAYKYIKARQTTTDDGSWLLRPDCGARRMGVEGHRVMMAYLMHMMMSTTDMTPPTFEEFRQAHSEAKVLESQNVVRAFTKDRFTCFSWNTGLPSYTGYFAPNSADNNKILVPYRANQSGNFLGWYTVSGKSTDVSPVVSGIYDLQGDAYTMNGEVQTNEKTLDNRFAIYSTPSNAIIYLDYVTGLASGTITGEYGGLMAISTDDFTKLKRTLYYDEGNGIEHKQLDGASFTTFNTTWMNIDDQLGVVGQNSGKSMAFGDRAENNSIMTSKLYPMYKTGSTSFSNNGVIGSRNLVYYSNIDAETTAEMNDKLIVLSPTSGWNAVIAPDPDGTYYLLISNFKGSSDNETLSNLQVESKAPVFPEETTISNSKSTVTFELQQNHSAGRVVKVLVEGTDLVAKLRNDSSAYITASSTQTMTVYIGSASKKISIDADQTLYVTIDSEGNIIYEDSEMRETAINPTGYIVNPNFDEDAAGSTTATGWEGTAFTAIEYSLAEAWNKTYDIYQTITGLPEGCYVLSCQGFYRNGSHADAAKARTNGSEALNAVLYATNGQNTTYSTSLMSIFEEADQVGPVGVSESAYGYIPDDRESAHYYFLAGLYPNSVEVEVGEDGKLTIGVKKTVSCTNDWTAFDTFSLTCCTDTVDWQLADEWGTLILPFNMEIPDSLEAWTYDGITTDTDANDILSLKEIVRSIDIKANKPYIMSGTQGKYTFTGATVNTTDDLTDGYLVGTFKSISAPEGSYVLQNRTGSPAFYEVDSGSSVTVAPYHCYLTLTEDEAKAVVYFPGSVPSDKTTGIETVSEATANGNGAIYDMSGRRVQKAQKGVYIVDGKKVVM